MHGQETWDWLTASPLFQGILVIEGTLVYALSTFGVRESDAFAGTIVFRFFHLWVPLIAGAFVYFAPFVLRSLKFANSKIKRIDTED